LSHQTDITKAEVENRFGAYKKPTESIIPKLKAVQEKALEFALLIDELCPNSREKATALTELASAKMYANAAIALYSKEF